MRIGAATALLAALIASTLAAGCSRGERFRELEYEEEIVLSLDGRATVYVNSSVAALNALRGTSFPTDPAASIDREAVRAWFNSPVTRVTRRPSLSRRHGRRFVHVRLDVDDITRLKEAAPFAWSTYRYEREGDAFVYHQTVGASAGKEVGEVGWDGREGVAFRMQMPSTVLGHNAGPANYKRGNILIWEQLLTSRLQGEPVSIDARIESRSILSRALLLFAATGVAVALTFAGVLWAILRRGTKAQRSRST